MLRELFKRIQGHNLKTPVKVGEGRYCVPAKTLIFEDGEIRQEISMKSIVLMLIAEEIGTDEPQALLREYARRRFVQYVRQVTAEQEMLRLIDAAETSSSRHGGAKIIPFPEGGIRRHKATIKRKPAICGSSDIISEDKSAVAAESKLNGAESAPKTVERLVEPITEAEVVKSEPKPVDKELVDAAIEEALLAARNDEERAIFREYLEKHPELAEDILDDCTRIALGIDEHGKVQVARKHYRYRNSNVHEA